MQLIQLFVTASTTGEYVASAAAAAAAAAAATAAADHRSYCYMAVSSWNCG